jgi:hypothetical protein
MEIDPNRWYRAGEAAPFLKCGKETVKRYCKGGDFSREECRQTGKSRVWEVKGVGILRLRELWYPGEPA